MKHDPNPGDLALSAQPLVILGAARSGTNILRDVLTALPGFATWPCDEINPLWRHGNLRYPSDELPPERATRGVRRFIRAAFDRLARHSSAAVLVEKTCANSLRVDFVDRVLPEARYVFLVRDGRDVTASAMRRWTAKADLAYSLRKARFVPLLDLPFYAWRFFANRLYRLRSGEDRLAVWGPRFDGMDEAAAELSLAELCALQWQRSVRRAEDSFALIDAARVYRLRYEDLTARPAETIVALLEHLGLPAPQEAIAEAVAGISRGSVGNWRRHLNAVDRQQVAALIGEDLERLGYVSSSATPADADAT